MPKHAQTTPARPAPTQLTLFAEAASLVRVQPALNQWRYYRMEIWPDLFGTAAARFLPQAHPIADRL